MRKLAFFRRFWQCCRGTRDTTRWIHIVIHTHPHAAAMPIEQKRQNKRQRCTPQERVNDRNSCIRCQRKHNSRHDQFTQNEIDRHSASKISFFTLKLKVTDRAFFVQLKHAREYFSSRTDRTAEKEAT